MAKPKKKFEETSVSEMPDKKSDSVFVIRCSAYTDGLQGAKLFSTLDKAKAYLKKIAKDRRYKFGVDVIVDTDTEFTTLLGWEETRCSFKIIEIPIDIED